MFYVMTGRVSRSGVLKDNSQQCQPSPHMKGDWDWKSADEPQRIFQILTSLKLEFQWCENLKNPLGHHIDKIFIIDFNGSLKKDDHYVDEIFIIGCIRNYQN